MGYKHHDPATYLVCWDEAQIVKAGYSHCQRWRRFEARGARLLGLAHFATASDAFLLETALDQCLRTLGTEAFASKSDSLGFVGIDGGGWMECVRVPDIDAAEAACERILRTHCDRIIHERDVRTH